MSDIVITGNCCQTKSCCTCQPKPCSTCIQPRPFSTLLQPKTCCTCTQTQPSCNFAQKQQCKCVVPCVQKCNKIKNVPKDCCGFAAQFTFITNTTLYPPVVSQTVASQGLVTFNSTGIIVPSKAFFLINNNTTIQFKYPGVYQVNCSITHQDEAAIALVQLNKFGAETATYPLTNFGDRPPLIIEQPLGGQPPAPGQAPNPAIPTTSGQIPGELFSFTLTFSSIINVDRHNPYAALKNVNPTGTLILACNPEQIVASNQNFVLASLVFTLIKPYEKKSKKCNCDS